MRFLVESIVVLGVRKTVNPKSELGCGRGATIEGHGINSMVLTKSDHLVALVTIEN